MTSKKLVFALLFTTALTAASPVKLGVRVDRHSITAGDKLTVTIDSLDSANRPAKAPMPITVSLQARMPSKAVQQLQTVTIAAAQSSATATVSVPGAGLEYLWAKTPELIAGGAYINVRSTVRSPALAIAPGARVAPAAPQVTLRFSPDRVFLADGKDAVNIEAFLLNPDVYPEDIHLSVFGSSSNVNPVTLTIPAGQASARVGLTSNEPGTVTAEFLSSAPEVSIQGDKALNIHFGPPITHLRLSSSPPSISLVDTATVFATLVDDQGIAQNTDAARNLAFSIASGKGQVDSQVVQIPAGQSTAQVKFHPEWRGAVTISAATANLMNAEAPLRVTIPLALLLCSVVGALMGSILPQKREKKRTRKWHPFVALITGFLLYWFSVFVGLGAIGHDVALNPITAIAISALGGWLQTGVLEGIWNGLKPGAQTISSATGSH